MTTSTRATPVAANDSVAYSSVIIGFTLSDTPYSYDLLFNAGPVTGLGPVFKNFSFNGPGVNVTTPGHHTGVIQPGAYTLSTDTLCGSAALFGFSAITNDSVALNLAAVPEPSSFALLALVGSIVFTANRISRYLRDRDRLDVVPC